MICKVKISYFPFSFPVALAFGVETSAMANNFVTCLNIFILGFVIIAGAIKGKPLIFLYSKQMIHSRCSCS